MFICLRYKHLNYEHISNKSTAFVTKNGKYCGEREADSGVAIFLLSESTRVVKTKEGAMVFLYVQ